tara:strand:- start:845 stop:1084 length:240 start_codon:yes stop_codon:yes gene_type:complete
MKLKRFTKNHYHKFSQAEGSQYIASEYALFRILELIEKFRPHNILEVGMGIGTISDSILKCNFPQNLQSFATEADILSS